MALDFVFGAINIRSNGKSPVSSVFFSEPQNLKVAVMSRVAVRTRFEIGKSFVYKV